VSNALTRHWPEYLMEALGLGLFMVSACVVTVLVEHPASPLGAGIGDPVLRRGLIGIAMGLTAVGLIYSPWGKRSGAHLNPSVTLTFFRLGKIERWDALFYVLAQFVGGVGGVLLAAALLGDRLAHPAVGYAATRPGPVGPAGAFAAEVAISLGLMTVVLLTANAARLARFSKHDTFEGRSALSSWIYRVTMNAALNRRRGQRTRLETPLDALLPTFQPDGHRDGDAGFLLADWSQTPERELLSGEWRAAVNRAIDGLPEHYRAVLVLRDVENLTNEQVAELMGESIALVKSRLHRARMALREQLTRHYLGTPA
jgi:RNA polymerase sigma factor (sigma-70 family)